MNDEQEEWRPVAGWEGIYEVSSLGRVRSLDRLEIVATPSKCEFQRMRRGRVLRPSVSNGYQQVLLYRDGKKHIGSVHRIVSRAFHGDRPVGAQVAHFNGDRRDNRAVNLRWASSKDNHSDRARHGTDPIGKRNPAAILSEAQVIEIRASNASEKALSEKYGVSPTAIGDARRGKTWKHL